MADGKMAKILILGGTGFIGSYITRKLLDDGNTVTSIDNFSKYGSVEYDFFKNPKFKLIKKDVREMTPDDARGYDYVFVLAALIGGIGYLNKVPYQIAKNNTEIIIGAIEAIRAGSPKSTVVYFSSSLVFERAKNEIVESDLYEQQIPKITYSLQKLFGEYIVRGAHQEFGLNYVIVRPFNVVGGGELPRVENQKLMFGIAHVIPDLVYRAIKRQSPIEIMGDGKQLRTYTHVEDFADAMALIVKKNVKNEDFNICGSESCTVEELAQRIWARVNPSIPFPGLKHLPAPDNDVRFRKTNTEKAQRILGWKPKRSLDSILDDSIKVIRATYGNG